MHAWMLVCSLGEGEHVSSLGECVPLGAPRSPQEPLVESVPE